MKNDEFSNLLELRTRKFSVSVLKLSIDLSVNPVLEETCECLARAGVGVGASYWEAYRMENEEEYYSFIEYGAHDLTETIRWLKVVDELHIADAITVLSILHEAGELQVVFNSILEERKLAG